MGGEKCMSQRVVPEILDTPKGVRGKIHRKKKQSLHEHKINILTEFTNITNHKTYLFEQTVL